MFENYLDKPKFEDLSDNDRLILTAALKALEKYEGGGMAVEDVITGLLDLLVTHLDFRGWRFYPPFICMGCGIVVDAQQWMFSRSCGPCDVSQSRTRRIRMGRCFAGRRERLPTWNMAEGDIPEDHFIDPSERVRPRLRTESD